VAMADVDGDGDPDLFVGARAGPGRYPVAGPSRLLLNTGNGFEAARTPDLENAGIVRGAVFSDLDGDGNPELILACEWGPIRVFRFRSGAALEITAELGLDRHRGWWTCIAAGDFDGDGRMDLAAGNWGRNTRHRASHLRPLRVYSRDVPGVEVLEAFEDPETGRIVPWRDREATAAGLPGVAEGFPTSRALAEAD